MTGISGLRQTIAQMRAFAADAGALSLTLAVDQGSGHSAAVVSLDIADGSVEVREGDEVRHIDDAALLEPGEVEGRVHVHRMPPFDVDLDAGEFVGALGGLEHLATATAEFASLFGSLSVVVAAFETTSGPPLEIVARADGEKAIHCGGLDFDLPDVPADA